jgi:CRISPR-associated protein Cas5d
MTPSAARGILEAILWKPAIAWHIERICVLNEIKFTAFRRNEIKSKAIAPALAIIKNGGEIGHYFADDDRSQRNTVALSNVDYIIDANFSMTDKAGTSDNMTKFVEMFERRLAKGQHYHQPYLGCREFAADVMPVGDVPEPIRDNRELGLMLWDVLYGKKNVSVFFKASLEEGILNVPASPEEAAKWKGVAL